MVKPEYEEIIQKLLQQQLTTFELSDEQCREILRYLILKLRLKF